MIAGIPLLLAESGWIMSDAMRVVYFLPIALTMGLELRIVITVKMWLFHAH